MLAGLPITIRNENVGSGAICYWLCILKIDNRRQALAAIGHEFSDPLAGRPANILSNVMGNERARTPVKCRQPNKWFKRGT